MDSLSNTVSASSSPASRSITSLRRQNFDARSQTAVSASLRARSAISPENDTIKRLLTQFKRPEHAQNSLNWSETTLICKTLNHPSFVANYGSPSAIELSPTHILVGTHLGRVAMFNYHQKLEFVLDTESPKAKKDPRREIRASPVTCIAVSATGVFVCAGHASGTIVVWEIPRQAPQNSQNAANTVIGPYGSIRAVSLEERAASSEISGHLNGVAVNTVSFIGDSHCNLVSTDLSGLVLFHHGIQRLFRRWFVSQRVLGHHIASEHDIFDRFSIHDSSVLPVGTVAQLTDHLGLMAVITSSILVVVSVCSLNNDATAFPKTHFKITRPRNVSAAHSPIGCVSWYPSIRGAKGSRNAKLAYSWNHVVTILELDNSRVPQNAMSILADLKDKDRAIPDLHMYKTARWAAPEPHLKVVSLNWLNSEILAALILNEQTSRTKLHFLYYTSHGSEYKLILVGTDDVDSQQVAEMPTSGNAATFYNSSLRIFRHRPVVLVNSHSRCSKSVFTGSTAKWADRLVALITKRHFASALLCAYEFYCSENTGHLLLTGLPHTAAERHAIVEPFLLDLMRESLPEVLQPQSLGTRDALWLYFHITSILSKEKGYVVADLLDIMDSMHEITNHAEFFDVLEPFVMSGQILSLSPTIFKSLVETYVETGLGDRLTEIICLLDSSTLNIDSTLKLCEKHGLRECVVYIWTTLLKDYLRPFMMLMSDMDLSEYNDEEKCLVYTYVSYMLSGRRFPTDEYMNTAQEEAARSAVCKVLFSLQEIDAPPGINVSIETSVVFPYLYKFLRFNAFETLATLNEFFENPCLNTDAKGELNRQYVVEALIDIFRENKDVFTMEDRAHLAIFVARNYPKYFQFIRVSESVLQETVEMLCSSPESCHGDAELALESLLPVYDVKNEQYFLERIKAARFYRVAFALNRSMQKFSSALDIWLEQQKDVELADIHVNFSAFSDIVANAFKNQGVSQVEQARLFHTIEQNFETLISKNMHDMVVLANAYNPAMHSIVMKCHSKSLAFDYLRTFFEDVEPQNYGNAKLQLLVRYVTLSCEFARDKVCNLVDKFSTELSKHPAEHAMLQEELKKEQCFGALAILSRNNGEYGQSMTELKDGLTTMAERNDWGEAEGLISIGLSICEKDKSCWQSFVQSLVGLTLPVESDSKLSNSVNEGIYTCFRRIIDMGEKEQNPQFFTDILQEVMDNATVLHVREVLQETLTSFYYDSEIHNITLGKLNDRIRKYMDHIRTENLRGWVFKAKYCTSCGKPMRGDQVLERHREAWEHREKAKVFSSTFEKEKFKDCELVLFKCTHAYHSQCLERLGSSGRCVICTQ
ncbi:hypothetical protein OY671_003623 [Metschnikowia pulcherrima]|nr:hypothetical protein OY671_003623 [Metschnikowia pulcherrima]